MIEQGWGRHIDLSNGLSEVCKWTSIIMIGIELWYLCWKWLHHSIQQRHWLRWCWKIIEKWWLNEGVKKNNLLQSILWNAWKKVHGFTFSVPAYLIFLIATLRIFFSFFDKTRLVQFYDSCFYSMFLMSQWSSWFYFMYFPNSTSTTSFLIYVFFFVPWFGSSLQL